MKNIGDEKEKAIVLNRLAREQMKHKLLTDITVDLQICQLEKLDPKEYIKELKKEIDEIYEKLEAKKNVRNSK